ncbi:hypothetical protein [Citrobacter koseri]|uniref:hypothetical protein n=1 Tax=Citrobacter koseri TaxID=545 RepID=UPI00387E1440
MIQGVIKRDIVPKFGKKLLSEITADILRNPISPGRRWTCLCSYIFWLRDRHLYCRVSASLNMALSR